MLQSTDNRHSVLIFLIMIILQPFYCLSRFLFSYCLYDICSIATECDSIKCESYVTLYEVNVLAIHSITSRCRSNTGITSEVLINTVLEFKYSAIYGYALLLTTIMVHSITTRQLCH